MRKSVKKIKIENSLFAVGFEASSAHLIEGDAVLLLPFDFFLLESLAAFFKLADLKFEGL